MAQGRRQRAGGRRSAEVARAWVFVWAGVLSLLFGVSAPLTHSLGLAFETGEHGCAAGLVGGETGVESGDGEPFSPERPDGPSRHFPDGCAVCQKIQAGGYAGVLDLTRPSVSAALRVATRAPERTGRACLTFAVGASLARGPPTDRA